MRSGLEPLIGLIAIAVVLIPAIAFALMIFTALALSYYTAALLLMLGISVRVFGNRFLKYLERKRNQP